MKLKEELGTEAPLTKVCKFKSLSDVEREISVLYACRYDGPVRFNEKEISEGIHHHHVIAGLIISKTPWGGNVENEHQPTSLNPQSSIKIIKPRLDERLWGALKFGGYLAKRILPCFFFGLVVVSYVEAHLAEEVVAAYLTGTGGVLLASVIGGSLYTPTLVEIVLGRGLMDRGISKAAMLSWLMG